MFCACGFCSIPVPVGDVDDRCGVSVQLALFETADVCGCCIASSFKSSINDALRALHIVGCIPCVNNCFCDKYM